MDTPYKNTEADGENFGGGIIRRPEDQASDVKGFASKMFLNFRRSNFDVQQFYTITYK